MEIRCTVLVVLLGLFVSSGSPATFGAVIEDPASSAGLLSLGLRGVYFVPNEGQWTDAEVRYGLRSRGLDVAFRESSFTMHLSRKFAQHPDTAVELRPGTAELATEFETLTLGVSFPGSNNVTPEGALPQVARFNYFVGGEGRGTARDLPSFGAVVYHNLYDGVDLHVMGSDDGVMKYEFHVERGADYGQIRIAYDGIESLCVDDAGDLRIETAFGTLADGAPIVWQEVNGKRGEICARFELCDQRTYRIAVHGEVDASRMLVIDPDVVWMLYLGGRGVDEGHDIVVTDGGDYVISGTTGSSTFEGRGNSYHGGWYDGFVCQVSPTGVLQWMTYVGGSDLDLARGLTIDDSGLIYVVGATSSVDFEGRTNSYFGGLRDAYVVQLDAQGRLGSMTYVGGTGEDFGYTVRRFGASGFVVVGTTDSPDLVAQNNTYHGGRDVYVAELDENFQILWTTYVGGSGEDVTWGSTLDARESVFFAGRTTSSDFEGRRNSYHGGPHDAFIVELDRFGDLQWMNYIGGAGDEYAYAIAADQTGSLFVIGATASIDFEGRSNSMYGGLMDTFVVRCETNGQLQQMVYLGGTGRDEGAGIMLDDNGTVLVAGLTSSIDFEGSRNTYFGGVYDGFIAALDAALHLNWMVYVGGSSDDYVRDVALGDTNELVGMGATQSTDFIGGLNSHHTGLWDVAVLRLDLTVEPLLAVNATCPSGGPVQVSWTDATPGGRVALFFARDTGSFAIPTGRPCAGTVLGLGANQLQIAFQGSAGPNGSRTLNSNAGPAACGGYLQLLDIAACATSNAAQIE